MQNNCLDLIPAYAGMTRIKDSCKKSGWDYLGPVVKPQDDIVRKYVPLPRPADTPCAVRRGLIQWNAVQRGLLDCCADAVCN